MAISLHFGVESEQQWVVEVSQEDKIPAIHRPSLPAKNRIEAAKT